MEELDLKELFNIFWNKKVQIILIILIFIAIGIIYTIGFTTPKYSSSTTLVLASSSNNQTTANTITATDITVNSKLVSTYSELVKSKNVLRQVISNLNIEVNESSLRNNVKVSSVKDTELIEITVTNENPTYASKIANEIAKVFTGKVKEIYNIDNVQVVDEAEISNTPSNINHKKDIVIFAFVGLVVAAGYVLVANMLDTTVKTAEEVEKEFKLPVLASIPIYDAEPQKVKGRGGRK
ncbi:MAG: hypothetical protein HFJ40_07540 [Clostridia bacterium]|nr:hypothetical protein [Clostridia bacterium]